MPEILPASEKQNAACANDYYDPEWWFSELNTNLAISICTTCPVKVRCLQYAVDNNEQHGIWGGTTPEHRHKKRKKLIQQLKG
jgi:WhiB family redox-sensing transcriptional regulator